MKILKNPLEGSDIKNIWFKDVHYFDPKKGQVFARGDFLVFDDDEVAAYFLDTFGFLQELTEKEAKEYQLQKSKEVFTCDQPGCKFTTNVKIALAGHKRTHTIDSGIPTVRSFESKKETQEEVIDDGEKTYRAGEQQDKEAGLIGEGLTDDPV